MGSPIISCFDGCSRSTSVHTYEDAGEYAEITVPSLTPSSLPANTKESTAAITAMDTSKQILVVPKFVFYVRITI